MNDRLSELMVEFRALDAQRRRQGLSIGEAGRYRILHDQLSGALNNVSKQRGADGRHSLRVPLAMTLILRTTDGDLAAVCHDFGGGGCAIATKENYRDGDDVWIDGAIIEGKRFALKARGQVVWKTAGSPNRYGLRFQFDVPTAREQIDRILFRVLDAYLQDDHVHQEQTREIKLG